MRMKLHGPDEPVYAIGVVARLLGVGTHTLRLLDREGLVCPDRVGSNIRFYSENQVVQLKRVCFLLKEERINIRGIKVILTLEDEGVILSEKQDKARK